MSERDRNVFFFGGRFSDQYFEFSLNPFTVSYEDNHVLGAGYQQFFLGGANGPRLGLEAGTSLRFGNQTSGELWGGLVGRYDGLFVTDAIRFSAAITVGLSVTTGTIGIERDREVEMGGDSSLLYYLGPELSLAPTDNPNLELFWRIHHRSGGWETLGDMRDGANATALGVRVSF